MRAVAYLYVDLLLEAMPEVTEWSVAIVQVYQDLAVAPTAENRKGTSKPAIGQPRPQWERLVQECGLKPTDYVIVRQLADLGESVQAVSDRLAQLEALQIPVVLLEQVLLEQVSLEQVSLEQVLLEELQGLPESATALPPLMGTSDADRLQRSQALQQQQRSRRIRQGHAHNRAKALPPPGKAPYGYRRSKTGYIVDRTTAPVIKDFFEQFLLYGSVRGAVRYLAKRYGKKVAASTGQRWLTNPVYRGDLEYQDGRVIRDTHAAILSRDEAAQIDRLLRRNRQLPPRVASAPRSLAGLVSCAECQSPMTIAHVTTHNRKQDYLYLRPRHCPKQPRCGALPYDDVLQATIQRICEDLPQAVAGAELPDMSRVKQGIEGAIVAKQALLNQLPPLLESGVLDPETATLRTYKLQTEMAQLQARLAQLPPVDLQATAQTVSIPQFWLDLSESERRFYFREFLREIQLHRHNATWELKLIFFFSP